MSLMSNTLHTTILVGRHIYNEVKVATTAMTRLLLLEDNFSPPSCHTSMLRADSLLLVAHFDHEISWATTTSRDRAYSLQQLTFCSRWHLIDYNRGRYALETRNTMRKQYTRSASRKIHSRPILHVPHATATWCLQVGPRYTGTCSFGKAVCCQASAQQP